MRKIIYLLLVVISFSACRSDNEFLDEEEVITVTYPLGGNKIKGFYLLNEGNMGSNQASIDYFDYDNGNYHRNIFPSRNPSIVKELGDVGNDIRIYGGKLYAVINCSNMIEVMDLNGIHIKNISLPNCRYIRFKDDKAYVSSYATTVSVDPNAGKGLVFEIDTLTLSVQRKVEVGYQPEEMLIQGNKMYVANSGGYRVPDYDHTVSVIDLNSFTETKKIDVGINLHRIQADKRGDIYVSSRGDYYDIASALYVVDSNTDEVKQKLDIPVSNMCMLGDSLYYSSVAHSRITGENQITYGILDTRNKQIISDKVITDGTDKNIKLPYGLNINPETKEIFITDAQNYVVTGVLYCFSPEGKYKWSVLTGNIPAHIAFMPERKEK